jgi:hypothetical protein
MVHLSQQRSLNLSRPTIMIFIFQQNFLKKCDFCFCLIDSKFLLGYRFLAFVQMSCRAGITVERISERSRFFVFIFLYEKGALDPKLLMMMLLIQIKNSLFE